MASTYESGMDTIQFITNGNILNLIKGIYEKQMSSIILDDERVDVFPLRSRIRQDCLLHYICSPLY